MPFFLQVQTKDKYDLVYLKAFIYLYIYFYYFHVIVASSASVFLNINYI